MFRKPDKMPKPESLDAVGESSVRQLIAQGKHKVALERAKQIHKASASPATEALVVDAYAARIRALLDHGLLVEAKALSDLVRERYPSAGASIDQLRTSAEARQGNLDALLRPLNDPAISLEQRTSIEEAVGREVTDLAALAECPALGAGHPLRTGARALHKAFEAVTSQLVPEDALVLPEVSRRSPLAPWKMLIRAIGCFYRREDEACRRYLEAVPPGSAASRLAPALLAMADGGSRNSLPHEAAVLVSGVTQERAGLRAALQELDRAFAADDERRILKGIRNAAAECRLHCPALLEKLKGYMTVRAVIADIDSDHALPAMGGHPRKDAQFHRLFARALEATSDSKHYTFACAIWAAFLEKAKDEGWFTGHGPEAAMLYIRMAELLRVVPGHLLEMSQASARKEIDDPEAFYYLYPELLYERACAIDPHSEHFSKWLEWASTNRLAASSPEKIAEMWHAACPQDLAPLLHLMTSAERRKSFHKAIAILDKAEAIDAVHPAVRRARLRLMFANAVRQLKQRKPRLAERTLLVIQGLPQVRQGDRRAFLAALRGICSAIYGSTKATEAAVEKLTRLLDSAAAANFVIAGAASACNYQFSVCSPADLSEKELAALPAAIARVCALAEDIGWTFTPRRGWLEVAARSLRERRLELSSGQLRLLAKVALRAEYPEMAYMASAAGLALGLADEARFLLLRAQALPEWLWNRRNRCIAAAISLARSAKDSTLIAEARNLPTSGSGELSIEPDELEEVRRRERAANVYPTRQDPGPIYSSMEPEELCDCPACRRERGEPVDEDEEPDLGDLSFLDNMPLPEGVPPVIARALVEEIKQSILRGESPDELLDRLGVGGKKRRKGKRR
ncbi:MAG: hypothetical protein WD696_06635 [Bryobacteraceae bacterium]